VTSEVDRGYEVWEVRDEMEVEATVTKRKIPMPHVANERQCKEKDEHRVSQVCGWRRCQSPGRLP